MTYRQTAKRKEKRGCRAYKTKLEGVGKSRLRQFPLDHSPGIKYTKILEQEYEGGWVSAYSRAITSTHQQ